MKKALLISNIADKFTNFIIPSIETLNSLGYEVHTCANYSNFKDDKTKYDIKMHQIDFYRNPFNLKNIRAYKQLLKLMKEEKFDIVHCNTPIGGLLGRICAQKTKVPNVIYTAHGFHFYKGAPWINKILYKPVERLLAHYTDVLITINSEDYEVAKSFKLRNNGKVQFVHGVGIDVHSICFEKEEIEKTKLEIGIKNDDIVCITVGELNKNKNHITILKAIKILNNRKIHLLICGDGNKKVQLERMSKKYNLKDKIHFLGFRNDVNKLLRLSDIYIQMSYREGLSRSIMEAMVYGLPCLVSRIRGNEDLIEEENGGYLCEPNSASELAYKLDKLIREKKLRKQMKYNNIQNVNKYDINVVEKELRKIYEEV